MKLAPDAIRASARGYNEIRDHASRGARVPVLTRIHVSYALTIPAASREKVDRALATHVAKCPTARSLDGAVEVTWDAEIEER